MRNITRYRGDSYADEFTILDPVTGQVLNITGCTFLLTVNSDPAPADVTNQKYALVGTIVNAPAGLVKFAPTTTQANLVGTFYYDVQMVDASSAVRTVESGKYVYVQDITKA